MKTNLSWLIILSITASIFYFCSDSKKIKEPIKKTASKDTFVEDLVWKDYNRIIGLITVKYSLKEPVVREIILEYLRINQPSYYSNLTFEWNKKDTTVFDFIEKPKETINITLDRLSKHYSIRKDSLNLLLLDFEIWHTAREKHE